jgi:heme A synthase
MQIVIGLAIALFAAAVILLALLTAGIRRQERAASLASEPRGLSAAIARRVLGLYASAPAEPGDPAVTGCPDRLITGGKGCRS